MRHDNHFNVILMLMMNYSNITTKIAFIFERIIARTSMFRITFRHFSTGLTGNTLSKLDLKVLCISDRISIIGSIFQAKRDFENI